MEDIKVIIEAKMEKIGVSRAEVCRRLGWQPQVWSSKMTDAKWSSVADVCGALKIDPADLFTKEGTTGFVECPKCHSVIKVSAKEVR